MLRKTFLFCLLPVLLWSCSRSNYYFNKRISHQEQQYVSEEINNYKEKEQRVALSDPFATRADIVINDAAEPGPLEKENTGPGVAQRTPAFPDSTKRSRVVEKENGEYVVIEEPEPMPEQPRKDSGWKTFWIIFGATSLVIFLIALALGFTVGQALLAIPLTYLIILITLLDCL